MIRLRTKTLPFNESFARELKRIGISSKTVYISERGQWNTYVCSVEFAKWLKSLSLKNIEEIVTRNKKSTIAFIRGFYESEGSAKKWYNVVYVSMVNSKRELIELLNRLITTFGFKTTIRKRFDKRYGSYIYELHILGSSKEKLKFLGLINPCIKANPKQYPLKNS
ncbi:MAG: LAGLIDADG family homing endonuclease [Candidatus Aenigmatarchaeota archaeon]